MTLTPDLVFRLLVAVAAVVFAALLAGRAFRSLGLPQVIGEVLAGLVLGPSLLGLLVVNGQQASEILLPHSVGPALSALAQLGLVAYMFVVGLEVDPSAVRLERSASVRISVLSIVTAFVGGVTAGWFLFSSSPNRLSVALFCGLGLCGSAFAILARILEDRQLFRTRMGPVLLGSAVVDDVLVWVLTPVVLIVGSILTRTSGDSGGNAPDPWEEVEPIVGFLVFALFLFLVVRPLLARSPQVGDRLRNPTGSVLAALIGALLLAGAATAYLLESPILGAFMLGAALPRAVAPALASWFERSILPLVSVALLPIFFAVIGTRVDVPRLIEQQGGAGVGLIAAFLAVAVLGKVLGASLGAGLSGFPARRSAAIGVLMSTRGLTELAILQIGEKAELITGEQFTVLVCASIGSTLLCAPLLALTYPRHLAQQDIELMERDLAASVGTYRMLLVLHDLDRTEGLMRLVAAAARSAGRREVVVAYLGPERFGDGVTLAVADISDRLERLRGISRSFEEVGLDVNVQVLVSRSPAEELLELVRRIEPTVVVVDGRGPSEQEDRRVASSITALSISDVVVVNDTSGLDVPPLVIGADGDEDSRAAAAELGLRIAVSRGLTLFLDGGREVGLFGRAARRLGVEVGDRHSSGVIVDSAYGPGAPVSAWGRPGSHRARIADSLVSSLAERASDPPEVADLTVPGRP